MSEWASVGIQGVLRVHPREHYRLSKLYSCYTLSGNAPHHLIVAQPGGGVWTDMREKNQKASENIADQKGTPKRPYKKPEFKHEKVFETMALACGKIHPTVQGCRFNRKFS